jgi:asparagine synthase (glutamine-hydrolysing)
MCGIYGIKEFDHPERPLSPLLDRMGGVIEHRGPDDSGHYTSRGVGIGMRRLSILDLTGGHQPISNEDGTIWLVLNGEIYNFKQLRASLEQNGHIFRTRTDTEVIVHLYEQVGLDVFKHLRGMFAIALWDQRNERLLLARDRIGEKPLYIRQEPGRLLFASEMKSILQLEDVPRRLDLQALREYLAIGYVPAPLSLLQGIRKLEPGHFLVVEKNRIEDRQYWEVGCQHEEKRSEEEWIECIREKLLETVHLQMVSDVPLGAFLSGGIDSSTIVSLMARFSKHPVKTYAIGYGSDHSYYDELPHARTVAKAFGTDHHEIIVHPKMSELLPKLVWHLDEPIADSACMTTYLVSKLARESVTVILSGVGGDELFGGYRRYLGDDIRRWYQWVPFTLRQKLLSAIVNRLPQDRHSTLKNYARYAAAFIRTAEQNPAERYTSYVTLFSTDVQRELFAGLSNRQNGCASEALQKYFALFAGPDTLNQTICVDLKTSLPDDLLALTDRMSMAASIECRAPLVDFELIELAGRLPSSLKVHNLKLKYLFKKAVAPWLPAEIIKRKKRGFGAPVGAWLRKELRPLVNDCLSREQVERRGLFQWHVIQKMLAAHQNEQSDYTDHIFALLMLEIWCRKFLDGGLDDSVDSGLVAGRTPVSGAVSIS